MAQGISAPRGTQDVTPAQSGRWQYVEKTLLDVARLAGYREMRVPVFEHTELFTRSVGDTTDVVQKEMYTFEDKGGRSITLRPEGTAGTVRSLIEHGLYNDPLPIKACYAMSCYRYEKPQAGRLREFHQFGVECFGAAEPYADAEVIGVASDGLKTLGVQNLTLEINSIGCPACRPAYLQALQEYFAARQEALCQTCQGRLERNPMRILDCKSPACSHIAAGAPHVVDHICDPCATHFDGVKTALDAMEISYVINPTIVRGLDYYTRTVFEFVTTEIGAQGTVCAGGRYDGLIGQMGGPLLPSLGFAMGLERLLLLMEAQGCAFPNETPPQLYIASMGHQAALAAGSYCARLRDEGFACQTDIVGRSLKAQMKYADKIGALAVLVLGDNEMDTGEGVIKDMKTGVRQTIRLDRLVEAVYDCIVSTAMDELNTTIEKGFSVGQEPQE